MLLFRASRLDHTYSTCFKPRAESRDGGVDSSSQDSTTASVSQSGSSSDVTTSDKAQCEGDVGTPGTGAVSGVRPSVSDSVQAIGNATFDTPTVASDEVTSIAGTPSNNTDTPASSSSTEALTMIPPAVMASQPLVDLLDDDKAGDSQPFEPMQVEEETESAKAHTAEENETQSELKAKPKLSFSVETILDLKSSPEREVGVEEKQQQATPTTTTTSATTAEVQPAEEPECNADSEKARPADDVSDPNPNSKNIQPPETTVETANESCADDVTTQTCAEEEVLTVEERYRRVLERSMAGLRLCLCRFPQHFKSLYRLADVYFNSDLFKVSFKLSIKQARCCSAFE